MAGALVGLTGCGGSGGGSFGGGSGGGTGGGFGGLTPTPVTAQITLPSGTPAAIGDLSAWSSAGTSNPNAGGQVQVTVFNNGPQYTDVRDSQGRIVLAGFLGEDRDELNAETTAELFAYFAVSGATQVGEGREIVLNGLKSQTLFASVVTEVENQIRTNGFVDPSSGELTNRLTALADSIAGRGRGTIVDPDATSSGVVLDTITDGELKITNTYLRRGYAWLERTGYVKDGTEHEQLELLSEFELEMPSRYGGWSGVLADLIQGNFIWTPVEMPSIAIPLSPSDADATNYRLSIIGLGTSQGDFLKMPVERQNALTQVGIKSLVLDIMIPVVANMLVPIKGDAVDDFIKFSGANPILSDVINNLTSTVPEVAGLIRDGQPREAFFTLWGAAVSSNTAFPAFIQMFIEWTHKYGIGNLFGSAEEMYQYADSALRILGAVDLVGTTFDMGIFFHDLSQSNLADVWDITTTGGKITVVPDDNRVPLLEPTHVAAVIQNKNPNAVYKYEWSATEGYRLTDRFGKTNTEDPDGVLTTSDDEVLLTSQLDVGGTCTVKCRVTRIDGPSDIFVDDAEANVIFGSIPDITPKQASVPAGTSREFSVSVDYDGDEQVNWRFSASDPAKGSVAPEGGTGSIVVFTADSEATGTVKLLAEAYVMIQGEELSLGTAEADIEIVPGSEDTLFILPKMVTYTRPEGNHVFAKWALIVEVPKQPGTDLDWKYFMLGYTPGNDFGTESAIWTNNPPKQNLFNNMTGPPSDVWWVGLSGAERWFNNEAEAQEWFAFWKADLDTYYQEPFRVTFEPNPWKAPASPGRRGGR